MSNTILTSFRLPTSIRRFLSNKSKRTGESQAKIIEKAIYQMMKQEDQWKKDLQTINKDKAYKKQQINLAEEHYED